jgi:subtilisin family serine protease
MPVSGGKGSEPSGRLDAQLDLIFNGVRDVEPGLAGAAAYPPDWSKRGDVDYLYRAQVVLTRDADADGVADFLHARPIEHDKNIRGLTLLELPESPEGNGVEDACARADRRFGEGVVTPDHIFYTTTTTACAATEPEEVPPGALPDPGVSTESCDGHGVEIAVLDSGLLLGATAQHSWLAGVTGEYEDALIGTPPRIPGYVGHGTFVSGVAATMAPKASIKVARTFRLIGAKYESDLVMDAVAALKQGVEIISLAFGTNTRKDIASLGFEIVGEQLKNYPGVVLVAAAGNGSSKRPFWPAAFGWTLSVGALAANWRSRASFTNYGPWVDVYAPGERLINAYAVGQYTCTEPPNAGQVRNFDGMARWSGTSFSTPLVAGLIAARMSGTGETAPQAAASLLALARTQASPGVGPILLPGQACGDQRDHGPHHGRSHGRHGGGGGCCCGCRG